MTSQICDLRSVIPFALTVASGIHVLKTSLGSLPFTFRTENGLCYCRATQPPSPADIDSPLLRICRPAASPRWGEMDRSLDCYILLISILLSTIWKQWEHQHLILFPYIPIDQHRPLLKKDLRSGPLINSGTLGIYSILLS